MRSLLLILVGSLGLCLMPAGVEARSPLPPRIDRVAPHVYLAQNFAIGSIVFFATPQGLIAIDATETVEAAEAARAALNEVLGERRPVRYLIYSHHHPDHVRGAPALIDPGTEIVAHDRLPRNLRLMERVSEHQQRLEHMLFAPELYGMALPTSPPPFRYPTTTYQDSMTLTFGGLRLELHHAVGQSDDHTLVWEPATRTAVIGDLYFGLMPDISNPALPVRDHLAWADALRRVRDWEPEALIGMHLAPLMGKTKIRERLDAVIAMIEHLDREVVAALNAGHSLGWMRQNIALPPALADNPGLAPYYGALAWNITGIYHFYAGWFDGNPAHLEPAPPGRLAQEWIELAGGEDPIMRRAEVLLSQGEPQLAIELLQPVLRQSPKHPRANGILSAALRRLGETGDNLLERNVYLQSSIDAAGQAETGLPIQELSR